jgi:hypothetical protein
MLKQYRFAPSPMVLCAILIAGLFATSAYAGLGEPPMDPCGQFDNDEAIIGNASVDLGDVAAVPIYVGSNDQINTFRFVFILPDEVEFDHVEGGTWTHDIFTDWYPSTRKLVVDNLSNQELMLPEIEDVFLTLYLTTHCKEEHAATGDIVWGSSPPVFLGYPGCTEDPIETKTNGSVTINQISMTFDIGEGTALIGDEVHVPVTCDNDIEFNYFRNFIFYDQSIVEIVVPIITPSSRTDGYVSAMWYPPNIILVSGYNEDGFGTMASDGALLYDLNFEVVAANDNDTGAVWFEYGSQVNLLDCDQELDNFTPQAIFDTDGEAVVPTYEAVFDFGDAAWNTADDCDSVAVPVMLKNNYPIEDFLLLVRYSDDQSDALESWSFEPVNHDWHTTHIDRDCGDDSYAYVLKDNVETIAPSEDFVTIGWLSFKNTTTGGDAKTYTLELFDETCPPPENTYVTWNDPVRQTTEVYTLADHQLDGETGSVDVQEPATVQISVPGAQSENCKWPPDCEFWAYSGLYVNTNTNLDEVSFRINFDKTKFCLSFQDLPSNVSASVHHSSGYADVTITDVVAAPGSQWFGKVRFTNGTYDDQSGSHTISDDEATGACSQSAVPTSGSGGSVFTYAMEPQYASCFPVPPIRKTASVPDRFELMQNHPNPFNMSTLINFTLAEPAHTRLEIFNIMGQRVVTLMDDYTVEGKYSMRWDGCDNHGSTVATGVYLYRLQSGEMIDTKKMVLLK